MAGHSEVDLDYVLVPSGFAIMLAYQLYFLHIYRCSPMATVLGMEKEDNMAWVDSILQVTRNHLRASVCPIIPLLFLLLPKVNYRRWICNFAGVS